MQKASRISDRLYELVGITVGLKNAIQCDTNIKVCLKLLGCGSRVAVDLAIAVDGSKSVDDQEFRELRDFVLNVVNAFPIAANRTRVGVLVYGTTANIVIPMNRYYNRRDLLNAVESMAHPKFLATNIDTAIAKVIN